MAGKFPEEKAGWATLSTANASAVWRAPWGRKCGAGSPEAERRQPRCGGSCGEREPDPVGTARPGGRLGSLWRGPGDLGQKSRRSAGGVAVISVQVRGWQAALCKARR